MALGKTTIPTIAGLMHKHLMCSRSVAINIIIIGDRMKLL